MFLYLECQEIGLGGRSLYISKLSADACCEAVLLVFWGNFLVNLSQPYLLESTEVVNSKTKQKQNNDQLLTVMR